MHKEHAAHNQANVPLYDPNAPAVRDIKQIMRTLPHRYPFQMVDKILVIYVKSEKFWKTISIHTVENGR